MEQYKVAISDVIDFLFTENSISMEEFRIKLDSEPNIDSFKVEILNLVQDRTDGINFGTNREYAFNVMQELLKTYNFCKFVYRQFPSILGAEAIVLFPASIPLPTSILYAVANYLKSLMDEKYNLCDNNMDFIVSAIKVDPSIKSSIRENDTIELNSHDFDNAKKLIFTDRQTQYYEMLMSVIL
jgi:hypothetical protein